MTKPKSQTRGKGEEATVALKGCCSQRGALFYHCMGGWPAKAAAVLRIAGEGDVYRLPFKNSKIFNNANNTEN